MRRRLPDIEDDGLVGYHGGRASPGFVELNSNAIMRGFDELPRRLRDEINYAPTPELGARSVAELVGRDEAGRDGPWARAHQHGDEYWQMVDEKVAEMIRLRRGNG